MAQPQVTIRELSPRQRAHEELNSDPPQLQLAELCTLLVRDSYGELSSQVFSTLALCGRLTSAALARSSSLSPRQVKPGLAVLVQQHLALYYTHEDRPTAYEVDWRNAYALVRSGKITELVEERFGEDAGQVMSHLLLLGHARIGDLADAYRLTSKRSGAAKPDTIQSVGQLHHVLERLLNSGMILRVRKLDYKPEADLQREAESLIWHEEYKDAKIYGPKKQAEFKADVQKLLKTWRNDAERARNDAERVRNDAERAVLASNGVHAGRKRKSTDGAGPGLKRRKIQGHLPHDVSAQDEEEDSPLEESMVVRVNQEKCAVSFRKWQLLNLVARTFPPQTLAAYSALLHSLEHRTSKCRDRFEDYADDVDEDENQPTTTTLEAISYLHPSVDLAEGLSSSVNSSIPTDGRMTPPDFESEDEDDLTNVRFKGRGFEPKGTQSNYLLDRNKQLGLFEQHLHILAEHSDGFVTKLGTNGRGEWRVNFRQLTRLLVQIQIETLVSARFGNVHRRLVRVLHARGKLEEKQVAKVAMLTQREIRSLLTSLHNAGIIELQEVPRDTVRQPNKCIYLWYFDQERCRRLLLFDTYKSMTRLVQRIKSEKAHAQHLVDKAERLDVVNHEEEYLSVQEREALRRWRDVEEQLLTQLAQQDDVVLTLRDFHGE
ncbi:RNA polymerase III subunit C82 [Elasticomyces elasticus]|nr:RNA polymerase III subunit C82 [Elasticomyces elasticus]